MAAVTKRPRLNGFINRVKLIGIELEGLWDAVPKGEHIVKDGSVKFPNVPTSAQTHPVTGALLKGEIVSKPIPVEKAEGWIAHAYPQHVNETCGLHVHMSFHFRANYARLMVPEFTTHMVDRLRRWAEEAKLPKGHPQWRRFDPNDAWTLQHCSHAYLGPEQIKMTRKDFESRGKPYSRYTFVNYCDGQHHTVEVRGLSMPPTPELAHGAVLAVVTATNEFLSKIKQREKPARATVKPRPEAVREFRSYLRAA